MGRQARRQCSLFILLKSPSGILNPRRFAGGIDDLLGIEIDEDEPLICRRFASASFSWGIRRFSGFISVVPSRSVLPSKPATERIFASTQYFFPVRFDTAAYSQCLVFRRSRLPE